MEKYYLDIVKYWINLLLEDENYYEISSITSGSKITIEVKLDKENMGKVIGKNGKIITSIRNIINSLSSKNKNIVNIIITEK